MKNIGFQQVGVALDVTNDTIRLLKEKLNGWVILSSGHVNSKNLVYIYNSQLTPELKDEITRILGEIEPELCPIIIKNCIKRGEIYGVTRGGLLSDIKTKLNHSKFCVSLKFKKTKFE